MCSIVSNYNHVLCGEIVSIAKINILWGLGLAIDLINTVSVKFDTSLNFELVMETQNINS